jgi:hypothetical protein
MDREQAQKKGMNTKESKKLSTKTCKLPIILK